MNRLHDILKAIELVCSICFFLMVIAALYYAVFVNNLWQVAQ